MVSVNTSGTTVVVLRIKERFTGLATGECKMFKAHLRRAPLSVKDALRMIQGDNEVENLVTDKQLRAHVIVSARAHIDG